MVAMKRPRGRPGMNVKKPTNSRLAVLKLIEELGSKSAVADTAYVNVQFLDKILRGIATPSPHMIDTLFENLKDKDLKILILKATEADLVAKFHNKLKNLHKIN
jgi:hypothetical protein